MENPLLERVTIAVPDTTNWCPQPIGPHFDWLDHDHIRLSTGRLAGREFELTTTIGDTTAAVQLIADGERVGQCSIERDPPGRGIVLWDIGVRPHLRQGGLCAVMTWVIFRELIARQLQSEFRIRMITSVRASGMATEVQNVGICVVANRLGMTSDFDAEKLLSPDNLVGIEPVPARDGFPPGLKLNVRTYPLVAIAVALDPDTSRPSTAPRVYRQLERDPEFVRDWARRGLLVISNGDYSLRAGGVDRFINALAVDVREAADFRRRVVPLA